MRILLIEDDLSAAYDILNVLENYGHEVSLALHDTGLTLAQTEEFSVIILARTVNEEDQGVQLLRTLRQDGDTTPVLLISGLGTVQDRIDGLRAGANDYLAKPLSLMELVARVDALMLPRKGEKIQTTLSAGDIHVDLLTRIVTREGRRIDLQPREYKLLEYLMRRPNQVVTRKELLEVVWKTRFDPGTSVIEVHLSRLRKKLDSPFGTPTLHTIRNVGFMFRIVERGMRASGSGMLSRMDARGLTMPSCDALIAADARAQTANVSSKI
jgi:two-component system, OmpR family, response regulator